MTTKLKPLKRYPTYQFHTFTSSKLDADSVFYICILETLRWLRLRLNKFTDIPSEIIAPEPDDYINFSEKDLRSFNLNIGVNMDCTYIRSMGVWSFRIFELDTGENIGTENERLPVNGRGFQTEISFLKHKDCVEIGVRTICSEPSDCDVKCTVFRPSVVKALADNADIDFLLEGFKINGSPLMVTNQSEFRNLERIFYSEKFNMPIAFVADSGYEEEPQNIPILSEKDKLSFVGFGNTDFISDIKAELSKADKDYIPSGTKNNDKKHCKVIPKTAKKSMKKLSVLDYRYLAEKTLGYAVICFVGENCFSMLKNKLGINICANEIVVYSHGSEIERKRYNDDNMKEIVGNLKNELRNMLKRSSFTFGDILFYSDARLADLKEKSHENVSLEEKMNIYKLENSELKKQNKELIQQNTDLQLSIDNTRLMQKQLKAANDELEFLKVYIENNKKAASEKENAYNKAALLIDFYRNKAKAAAYFPTHKDYICDWVRKNYSDNILITPRAEAALRKYDGELDISILCDGVYYLNAYAEYRRGKINENELSLYAESCNWEACWSGKIAVRTYSSDYSVSVDGRQVTLDMHLKHGVSSRSLIRIYFCWDDDMKKIIIGYMPDHLPTVSQST